MSPGRKTQRSATRVEQRWLGSLYEITKLLASFESLQETFVSALAMVARTLPLRSALLLDQEEGRSKLLVWPLSGLSDGELQLAKSHLRKVYASLSGGSSPESLGMDAQAGNEGLPRRELKKLQREDRRFIVIPLVVGRRPIFGALQLESGEDFDRPGLVFINAVANQLAIALDRDRVHRAALRSREQVLATVAHDLGTPLSTILLTTRALATQDPQARRMDAVQSLARIHRTAEYMKRLLEDLRDFASIEAGHLAIRPRPEEVPSLLRETIETFELLGRTKALRLGMEVEPGLPKAQADRDRVLQLLSNLIANAINVSQAGGRVTLRAWTMGRDIAVSVTDTGSGISQEDLAHLFERYWRAGEAQYRGTGLGLAIAQGIVQAHGGRIWVESELRRGSTFFFTLPASDEPPRR